MNNSIYKFSLDIHETASQVLIELKQNDTKREFYISLTENGRPYIIAKNCHAVFTAKKPDGKKIFDDCVIDGNVIRYVAKKPELTAVIGEALCEIRLYGAENELLTSPTFTALVNATVYQDGDIIESSDDFPALTSLYTKTNVLYEEVTEKLKNGELQGENGKSAYDIAVENGFEGTEEEWLETLLGPVYNTKKYNDILIEQKVVTEVFATNEELISSEGKVFAKFSDLPKTLLGLSKNPREIAEEIDSVCSSLFVAGDYVEFGNASVRYSNYVWLVDESDTLAEFSKSDTGCTGNTVFPKAGIYVLLWYHGGNSFMLSEDAEFSIKFKGELKKLDNEFLSEDVYVYDDEVKEGSTKAVKSGAVAEALKKLGFSGVQIPENIVSNVTELPENPKVNDLVALTENQIVNWDKVKIWNADDGIVSDDGSYYDFKKVTETNLATIGTLPIAIDLLSFEGKNVYSALSFYDTEKDFEFTVGVTSYYDGISPTPVVSIGSSLVNLIYMPAGYTYKDYEHDTEFTVPEEGWYFNDETVGVRQATENDLNVFKDSCTSLKIVDFINCAIANSEESAEILKEYDTSPKIVLDLFLSSVITILKPAGFYISKEVDGEIKWVPYVDTTITSITESTEDSGSNVVTFLNGQTLTIKNGSKGIQGEKGNKGDTGEQGVPGERGADGYTPVKGTDYFTEEDKAELVNSVLAALPTWQGGSY